MTLDELRLKIKKYSEEHQINPSGRAILSLIQNIPVYHQGFVRHYGLTPRQIIDSCDLSFKFRRKPLQYTDEEIIKMYKKLAKKLGHAPTFSEIEELQKLDKTIPSAHTLNNRFGSIDKLAEKCGLYKKTKGQAYKGDFLINELKRFYSEFKRIPTQKDFEGRDGYPSRKTFTNHFGKFNNALRLAGFDVIERPEYTKEFLINEIHRFIKEFGKQPSCDEMDKTEGYPSREAFRKLFGKWNNAIKETGLEPKVSNYTDEELEYYFRDFINKNDRIPTLHEFNNNPKYPSFWCYQNRFGSWNKAVEAYGFEVNEGVSGSYYTFENGEVCTSTYEFDVSNWLRKNKISYLRNIPYRDFIFEYNGRKNCDYGIIHNGEWIFLEIAGLYTTREKKSSMEEDYIKRFDDKVDNLLCHFNSMVLYPDDFKSKSLDELFSFLWDIESRPWLKDEPIYQGVAEEVI